MQQKQYPEILLVRFTKAQKVAIRKYTKKWKVSEAEVVRRCVEELV